jgi:hypothetical protein
MQLLRFKTVTLAAALIFTSVAGAVAQQDHGGWWPHWGMGRGMMDGGWGQMMGYGSDALLDRIDGRLAFLKTELKITPAQEQAWNELATVIRDTSEIHNKMMREMMKEVRDGSFLAKPLPERLQIQETHMSARLEQIRSIKGAVDKLYTQLDDTQKKAADDIVLPMMGMGMGRGMGRGMNFDE